MEFNLGPEFTAPGAEFATLGVEFIIQSTEFNSGLEFTAPGEEFNYASAEFAALGVEFIAQSMEFASLSSQNSNTKKEKAN